MSERCPLQTQPGVETGAPTPREASWCSVREGPQEPGDVATGQEWTVEGATPLLTVQREVAKAWLVPAPQGECPGRQLRG